MLLDHDDERDEEKDEVEQFDYIPPEGHLESCVVEPPGVSDVVTESPRR